MKKRTAQRVDQVSEGGFARFLSIAHSMGNQGLISLSVGEPDFKTPPHICEAAIQAMKQGYTGYTPTNGYPELRQAVAHYLKDRYGVSYDPEKEIVITVGSSQAMDLAFRATVNPGDEVVTPDPYYLCYPSCISLAHGIPVIVPTCAEDSFKLRADQLGPAITSRTKALLIGFPSNPTGTEMSRDDLADVAKIAEKQDLLVISDEIYSRLTYGIKHTCFASLPGMKERTVVLDGFSKTYAMTGWRLGFAAGPQDIISAMVKIHQHTMLSPSSVAQMAAIDALTHGEPDVKKMVAEYDRRRKVLVAGLNRIGLTCHEPQGAFYAFPSIKITGLTSEEFVEKVLLEEKVLVLPGSLFGKQGEGFVRLCYAYSLENIEEALRRLEQFVKRHRA